MPNQTETTANQAATRRAREGQGAADRLPTNAVISDCDAAVAVLPRRNTVLSPSDFTLCTDRMFVGAPLPHHLDCVNAVVALERFALAPETFAPNDVRQLKQKVDGLCRSDPQFASKVEGSYPFELLSERCEIIDRAAIAHATKSSARPTVIPLLGDEISAVEATVRVLAAQLGPRYQIVVRGGSLAEGLGWLVDGAQRDPRVTSEGSYYTRRVEGVPAFDLSAAALRRPIGEVGACVQAACCYARSGSKADQAAAFIAKTKNCSLEFNDLFSADPEDLPYTLDQCHGVLMIFAEKRGVYFPTFHRDDPKWRSEAYGHVVEMPVESCHLRAIIPVAEFRTDFQKGAFSILVGDDMSSLTPEVKRELFDAAFRDFNMYKYQILLQREGIMSTFSKPRPK